MSNVPETIGFWPRVWAFVVDTTCLTILLVPLGFLVYGLTFYLESGGGWIDFGLHFGLPFLLVLWSWKRWLATPGKMLIPAEIVDTRTLSAPSNFQLVIRYFGYFVSMLPLGLGMLWVLVDRRHQAWHDKLAGTLVVRSQKSLVPPRTARILNALSAVVFAILVLGGIGLTSWSVSSGPGILASYRQLQEAVDSGTLQGIMGTTTSCWEGAWQQDPTCDSSLCALTGSFFLSSCLDSARPQPETCQRILSNRRLSVSEWQARCQELGRPGTACVLLIGTLAFHCLGRNQAVPSPSE